jgi:hypothetical protein
VVAIAARNRRRTAGAALVAAGLLGLAAGGQSSFVVQGDHRIGGYAVKADGSLGGAVEAFGDPSTRRRHGIACDLTWRSLGLWINFYSLSLRNPCSAQGGRFGAAVVTGRRWRTSLGLRIGDPVARLRRLYPRARFHDDPFYGAAWWLVVRTSVIGDTHDYPGLRARVRNGRVSALVVRYAAGGD